MPKTKEEAIGEVVNILREEYGLDVEWDSVAGIVERVTALLCRTLRKQVYAPLDVSPGRSLYSAPVVDINGNAIDGVVLEVFRATASDSIGVASSITDIEEAIQDSLWYNLVGDIFDRAVLVTSRISYDGKTIELTPAPDKSERYIVLMLCPRTEADLTERDWSAIVDGAVGRYCRLQSRVVGGRGGFRAGSYAITGVAEAARDWERDAAERLNAFADYIGVPAFGQVVTR